MSVTGLQKRTSQKCDSKEFCHGWLLFTITIINAVAAVVGDDLLAKAGGTVGGHSRDVE